MNDKMEKRQNNVLFYERTSSNGFLDGILYKKIQHNIYSLHQNIKDINTQLLILNYDDWCIKMFLHNCLHVKTHQPKYTNTNPSTFEIP